MSKTGKFQLTPLAQYFSVFDLASGFHQIKMNPEDSHKTAFSTSYGFCEFGRMPFGLKNGPATFRRLMDLVLRWLYRDSVTHIRA